MTAPFDEDEVYARGDIVTAVGGPVGDGAFLVGRSAVAILAETSDVASRTTIQWAGIAPEQAVARGVAKWVFVREDSEHYRFLGEADVFQYSLPEGRICDVRFTLRVPVARDRWLALLGPRAAPNVPPFPEDEIAALATTATPAACWSALETFVARWYGTAREPATSPHLANVGPPLVHRLLHLARSVPELFCFNRLVQPAELAVSDGRVVFLGETQWVCEWATEPAGDDPRVWYRENEDGAPWIEEPVRLSRFVLLAVLYEAAMHARFGGWANTISDEAVGELRRRLTPIGAWRWCKMEFYARDGALAVLMMGMQPCLMLAAATPLALTDLADLLRDAEWDSLAF